MENLKEQEKQKNKQVEDNKEILVFTEFETKYRTTVENRYPFKHIMEDDLGLVGDKFLYVQSGDHYYINAEGEFLRHRFSDNKKDKRQEVTFKRKFKEGNNIRRTEVNLRVDNNSEDTIKAFVEGLGYKYGFKVYKYCDIYHGKDVTFVFYSVRDEKGKLDHFIEIEVKEDMEFTEDQAWAIIRKYEKILEPLGIKPQNRIHL